jgi:hypothetical protein
MQVARARVSQTGNKSHFITLISRASGTVQSSHGVGGYGREIFASATCSLQFAKASAAMLPQQEKNNSEDVQRGRANISGFICPVASKPSRRRTFDEYLSMAVASRRVKI